MAQRATVVLGLVAGVAAAAAILAGAILLLPPGTPPDGGAGPGEAGRSGTSSTASPVPASLSPAASPSAVPSGDATASPTPGTGSTGEAPFHVGRVAPPLAVPQLGGGTIDLAALRGTPVWVYFWATWCPSCRDDFAALNGFATRYAESGLVVLAIDVGEDVAAIEALVRQLEPVFPIGLDRTGEAQRAWGAFALPVHFWVDADGIVRDGALGAIGRDVMARGLATILPGVDVSPD